MRGTTSSDLESSAGQDTIHHQKALGTKALSSQTQDVESAQKPHTAGRGAISDKTLFTGENGQALLLAFSSGSNAGGNAVLIPVYRPSRKWADKMVKLEKTSNPVSVAALKESKLKVESWKRFRWKYSGESEAAIWNRIRSQFEAQMPFYYKFLPFWRPTRLEERKLRVHRKENHIFTVEIGDHVNIDNVHHEAEELFRHAEAELARYEPDDLCRGEFDVFGEWYPTFHGPYCRKGIEIDDYYVDCCQVELYDKSKWRLHRIDRHSDLLDCYKDPSRAKTVFPLTGGRIMDSCIRDKEYLSNPKLPQRSDPTRLPVPIRGIFVEYQFSMTKLELETGGLLSFVSAVVLSWKLATGDWNVAVGFGSLVVALATFILARHGGGSFHTMQKKKGD